MGTRGARDNAHSTADINHGKKRAGTRGAWDNGHCTADINHGKKRFGNEEREGIFWVGCKPNGVRGVYMVYLIYVFLLFVLKFTK